MKDFSPIVFFSIKDNHADVQTSDFLIHLFFSKKIAMNTDEFDGMCFCTLYNQEVNQKSYIRRID